MLQYRYEWLVCIASFWVWVCRSAAVEVCGGLDIWTQKEGIDGLEDSGGVSDAVGWDAFGAFSEYDGIDDIYWLLVRV